MSKPKWEDAPEGATHLAMDGDGVWGWYWEEPDWYESEKYWQLVGETSAWTPASKTPDYSGIDWEHASDTLESRP